MASLAASIAKVGGNTLVSRLLGFVRDLVIARIFGADAGTDAFFVAFRIPNLLRRLFAEGAFAMALVPVLSEYRAERGPAALKGFLDDMTGTLGAALLAITALGVLAAPLLVLLFAPGFATDPDQVWLAADLLRLTFPYLFFISLTALAGAVLNIHERFGVPAFTPVLLNVALILCAVLLSPLLDRPIFALAIGVLIAGVVQLLFQVPFLRRLGLLPRPRFNPRDAGVRRTLRLMVPALFGVSVGQISLLINTLLASFLVTGSISWLYYSDRLMELPLGVLGVALGTVILPRLSQQHAARSAAGFSATLDWALRWVLLLGLPAATGLAVLAGPIIATLFQSSEFSAHDVTMAARSLAAYALGLPAFMAIRILAPGYFSRLDMRTPVRIGVIALGAGAIGGLVLMFPLGHTGLALATILAATLNAALLLRGLLGQRVLQPLPGWPWLLARVTAATLAMGTLLWVMAGPTADWTLEGADGRLTRLALLILTGGGVYVAGAVLLGLRPRHLRLQERD